MNVDKLIEAVAQSNGALPEAALRGLGDMLATTSDAAASIALRHRLLQETPLRAADLDRLRLEAERRASEGTRARQALEAAEAGESSDARSYYVRHGMGGTPILMWRKQTKDGEVPVAIAHFVPAVSRERLRHRADGQTTRLLTCLLQTARGVVTVDLEPEDLADPRRFYAACIHAIGADAKLSGNASSIRHLPQAAFELADPDRERCEVFEFTGWYEQGEELVYLSAPGAIGTSKSIKVDLDNLATGSGVEALGRFGPRDDGDDAMASAVGAFLGPVKCCFSDEVVLPGLAGIFLAPLLRWSPAPDVPALHFFGSTGSRKTALLGVLQAFYGLAEPALSWRGTANSIEIAASALRYALVTVDDLKTSTSDRGAGVKVLQAYADRRGRSRATRSGDLARARFVRGLLVSAGEDIVAGEASVAARALFIPVRTDDADLEELTLAQQAMPHLPTFTARFIEHLIDIRDTVASDLKTRYLNARTYYRQVLSVIRGLNDAGRVASNCALLDAAMLTGVRWMQDTTLISEGEANALHLATREALESLAIRQAEAIDQESHALQFLTGLRALLDTKAAYLIPTTAGSGYVDAAGYTDPGASPGAKAIGWQRDNDGEILLIPDVAMAMIKRWHREQGDSFPVTRDGLYAQLKDGGWLSRTGRRTTIVIKAGGRSRRVLALREHVLEDDEDTEEETPQF